MLVRASLGTAIVLGLDKGWLRVRPTTAYLMTYVEGRCRANCAFCPQARGSRSSLDLLSRVEWPPYPIEVVVERVRRALREGVVARACIQVVNRPEAIEQAVVLAEELGSYGPVSLSIPPIDRPTLIKLREAGVDRVSIALDACTEGLFDEVKGPRAGGPYTWAGHWEALRLALSVFGRGRVGTHLIVGLGERELDLAVVIDRLARMGVNPGLFAFTPIPGTRLGSRPPPDVASYRRCQVIRYVLVEGLASLSDMSFDDGGRLRELRLDAEGLKALYAGRPFLTSGCPGCNRPFYNESPRGPIYNYPRPLSREEVEEAMRPLEGVLRPRP